METGPVTKSTKDAGAESVHLDDYLVLKPIIEKGELEGYRISQGIASAFCRRSGLEKGDVAIQDGTHPDMTDEAKALLRNWSKMKEAEVIVRRHAP